MIFCFQCYWWLDSWCCWKKYNSEKIARNVAVQIPPDLETHYSLVSSFRPIMANPNLILYIPSSDNIWQTFINMQQLLVKLRLTPSLVSGWDQAQSTEGSEFKHQRCDNNKHTSTASLAKNPEHVHRQLEPSHPAVKRWSKENSRFQKKVILWTQFYLLSCWICQKERF